MIRLSVVCICELRVCFHFHLLRVERERRHGWLADASESKRPAGPGTEREREDVCIAALVLPKRRTEGGEWQGSVGYAEKSNLASLALCDPRATLALALPLSRSLQAFNHSAINSQKSLYHLRRLFFSTHSLSRRDPATACTLYV